MQQRNFVVINGNYAGQWRSLNEATRSINLIVPFGIALIAAVFGILLHGIILWLVAATALSFIVLCEPRLGLYMLGAAIAADSVPLILSRGLSAFSFLTSTDSCLHRLNWPFSGPWYACVSAAFPNSGFSFLIELL